MKYLLPSTLQRIPLVLSFLIAGLLCIPGLAAASTEADALAKTIDSELRTAERLMFNGQKEESDKKLVAVAGMLEDLKGKDPGHAKLQSLETKYNRTRATLDKRMGIVTKTASARPLPPKPVVPDSPASPSPSGQATAVEDTSDRLPAGVAKRLRDIQSSIASAESYLDEENLKSARYQLDKVTTTLEEIDRMYADQFSKDHPDYVAAIEQNAAMEARINQAAEGQAAAEAAKAQAEADLQANAQSWIDRFSPYLSGSYLPAGHKPAKALNFPGTSQAEKIPAMQAIYEEAKAAYDEYLASGIAELDIPWQLEQAAKDLKWAMDGYVSSMESATEGFLRDARSNLDQALAQLGKNEWRSNPDALPPMIDKDWMERIDGYIKNLGIFLSPDDARLKELLSSRAEVARLDQEHRSAWQSRIRVRPEIYRGKDRDELREMAESIVKKAYPDAKILRTSVYKDDWKEESVIESTDSTNTAVRHRVTRMINAQVAARLNGEVLLHTLHLAKDKRTDGSWGSLYGHIMHSDRMLEENVRK